MLCLNAIFPAYFFSHEFVNARPIRTGLDDENVFHELSRLLSRIKGNFQLTEIVSCDEYDVWVNYCTQITIESFRNWNWGVNADYYLMNFWSRMVATLPYLKGQKASNLETFVPEVSTVFFFLFLSLTTFLSL